MKITVKTIELNARTSDIVILNGIDVAVEALVIKGSDKQIEWANKIARQALHSMIEARMSKIHAGAAWSAVELDATIAKLNVELVRVASSIDGKPASVWIDNRNLDAVSIIRAAITA